MMKTGTVNPSREAVIAWEVLGSAHRRQHVEAVIDTGFNGYLSLPGDTINNLTLPLVGNRRAALGDGTVVAVDVYLARVLWHEREREVLVLLTGDVPLLGMSLLFGSRVTIDVVDNGDVVIAELP
jgi:clan AA aspartic protease